VFRPGASLPWQEFVKASTGESLSPLAFASQFTGRGGGTQGSGGRP
jgi:hypothetical protein